MGASCAWRRLSDHATLRELASRVQVGIASQSQFPSSPELLRYRADLLRTMARRLRGRPSCAAAKPARPVLGAFLRLRLPGPVRRAPIRLRDAAWGGRRPA